MLNEQIIKEAIALARLDQPRVNVDAIEPDRLILDGKFSIADIRKGVSKQLKRWAVKEDLYNSKLFALYVIEFIGSEDELEQLLDKHRVEKAKSDEERGYKLTPENEDAKDGTKILYVGKSEGKIPGRLKEHLWQVDGTTSSLQLHRWVPAIKGTLRVNVQTFLGEPDWSKDVLKKKRDLKDALEEYALKQDALKDLEDELKKYALKQVALEKLEDALRRLLQPMFGE